MKSTSPIRKSVLPLTFAACIILAPAVAFAQVTVGSTLGTTIGQIATALERDGYLVTEAEIDGSKIEVEITSNAGKFEIEVDIATGEVLSVKDD